MKTSDVTRILNVLFREDRSTIPFDSEEWAMHGVLLEFAKEPTADDEALLTELGLAVITRAVLVDGVDLVSAGKQASGGRYSTDVQARAYAIAQLQTAARVLLWNARSYAPHRRAAAETARRYRDASAALRARVAIPA